MLTRNAFDDRESKQNNMVESIHKFKYMFPWGLGVDPPEDGKIDLFILSELLLPKRFAV